MAKLDMRYNFDKRAEDPLAEIIRYNDAAKRMAHAIWEQMAD